MFPAPTAEESFSAQPKLSERPLFEVTLGSEKPLLATPEAGEISLIAPGAPNMPLLAAPRASDLASIDLRGGGAISPLPGLPMLDFSRDVSGLNRSSPPNGLATRVAGFARTHARWLVMTGGTLLIATVSWAVFHAAAGSDTAAAGATRGAMAGAHTLATNPAVRPAATTVATAQAAAAAKPEPGRADRASAVEKNGSPRSSQ
jgi:hypothetical protein